MYSGNGIFVKKDDGTTNLFPLRLLQDIMYNYVCEIIYINII